MPKMRLQCCAPDPVGKLTALSQTPSWICGASSRRGEEGKGGSVLLRKHRVFFLNTMKHILVSA